MVFHDVARGKRPPPRDRVASPESTTAASSGLCVPQPASKTSWPWRRAAPGDICWIAITMIACCLAIPATSYGQAPPPDKAAPATPQSNGGWVGGVVPAYLVDLFEPHSFHCPRGRYQDQEIPYRLLRPKGGERAWPLLVWMHGFGEKGDNNYAQLRHLQMMLDKPTGQAGPPFFCVVMQLPADATGWTDNQAAAAGDDPAAVCLDLVDHLLRTEPIDPERVYLSGLSAGGSACWEMLARRPDLFAAAAPLAGSGYGTDPQRIAPLTHLPVWAFHSRADDSLSPQSVRDTVAALKGAGGSVALTEIDSGAHDCWTAAFRNHGLLEWLLWQRRGGPNRLVPPGLKPIDWKMVAAGAAVLLVVGIAIKQELSRRRRAQ